MKWMVAPSFQKMKIVKIDETKRQAYVEEPCWRCSGSGEYAWFGTCFKCNGSGKISKWVKAYTEEEYEKYEKAQERAKEKRVEKVKAELEAKVKDSKINKKTLLEKWGFEEEPYIYLILGNTYEIKDIIKERGGRYNPELGWHFNKETELPEGYSTVKVPFDELYDWLPMVKRVELKKNAKEVADAAKYADNPSTSEFVGELKQRLREIKVTLTGRRDVESAYGTSVLYTFSLDGNTLVWFSTSSKVIDTVVGNTYLLTGTVKEHKTYQGEKQTYLSRCILKEVA